MSAQTICFLKALSLTLSKGPKGTLRKYRKNTMLQKVLHSASGYRGQVATDGQIKNTNIIILNINIQIYCD